MKKITLLVILMSCVALIGCTKQGSPAADDAANNNGGTVATAEEAAAMEAFAECLTNNDLKMYGTEWCGHCKNQKKLFGDAFAKVDYTDCDAQRDACVAAGVQGFPTWIDVDGNKYPGTRQLSQLAEYAGCELPS